ncbi:MAG: hypothetical protein AB7G37_17455 [Solirubrobacteraceae bacterium]
MIRGRRTTRPGGARAWTSTRAGARPRALAVAVLVTGGVAIGIGIDGGADRTSAAASSGAERRAVVRLSRDAAPRPGDAVRIAGIPVGAVRDVVGAADGAVTVTLTVRGDALPLDRATRARVRRVATGDRARRRWLELLPPNRSSGPLPDGGTLDAAGSDPEPGIVPPSSIATGVAGLGDAADVVIGRAGARVVDADRVLRAVERQAGDARTLLRATGRIARAVGDDPGRLERLLDGTAMVLGADGRRTRDLGRTIRALPGLRAEAERTVTGLRRFADDHGPTIRSLRPVVRDIAPTLRTIREVAPGVRALARRIAPLQDAARRGLPGIADALDGIRPLADELDALLREVDPVLALVTRDGPSAARAVARIGAAVGPARGTSSGSARRGLRVRPVVGPESLAGWTRRAATNRPDPYPSPATRPAGAGLPVFEDRHCRRDAPGSDGELALLADTLRGSPGAVGPACRLRRGTDGDYPHLTVDPPAP